MIKKLLGRLIVFILIAASIGGFYLYYTESSNPYNHLYYGEIYLETFDLQARVSGLIKEINISEGDRVEAFTELARLDNSKLLLSRDQARVSSEVANKNIEKSNTGASVEEINIQKDLIKQLKSQIDALNASISGARQLYEKSQLVSNNLQDVYQQNLLNYEDIQELYNQGIEAKVNLDQARLIMNNSKNAYDTSLLDSQKIQNDINNLAYQIDSIEAQISGANEQLLIMEQGYDDLDKSIIALNAELAELNEKMVDSNLEDYRLMTAKKGQVESIYYEVGEFIRAGSSLATLYDPNLLYTKIYVSEKDLLKLDLNQSLVFNLVADKSVQIEGRISHIASEAMFTPLNIVTESDRERLVFEITLEFEAQGKLKSGMLLVTDLDLLD